MKKQNPYKGFINQSYFDLRFTSWANNHNGRAKAKRFNKREAKRRERRHWKKEVENND